MNVSTRRLQADWDSIREALREHRLISVAGTAGTPPQRYHIAYRVKGLEERPDGSIVEKDEHLAEITLLRSYPRQAPLCRMLSPVFHPNIAPHSICIGDHWSAGESLLAIILRIGEMIAFQCYNIKSPLNGEAARWVEENLNHLPIDPRPLTVTIPRTPATTPSTPSNRPATAARSSAPPPSLAPSADIMFKCPKCLSKLSAQRDHAGMEITCPKCGTDLRIPRP